MNIFRQETLKWLKERASKEGSPVLSVYLNIDPSVPANAKGGYKTILDQMLARIEKEIANDGNLRNHFKEDSQWILKEVETLIPAGKTFVAFCDVSEKLTYKEEVPLRFPNIVLYEELPYIRPILEAMDEYERYVICLLDSEKARLFLFSFGQLEEIQDTVSLAPVKYRKTVGTDHMRSQTIFQRRAETWTNWFLKDTSNRIYDLIEDSKAQYIILMGPTEITSELFRLLPKALQEKVVARLRMSVKAKPEEVLEVILPVVEERERATELRIVTDLITTASKMSTTSDKAVIGINPTLDVINQGRAYLLVYPSGTQIKGYFCPKCEVLLDHPPEGGKCPYCLTSLETVDDLIWLASEKVLASGGKIEEVKSEDASKQLLAHGIIGAFLR
jgi:peptide subunit release factor 1 (eRF1)